MLAIRVSALRLRCCRTCSICSFRRILRGDARYGTRHRACIGAQPGLKPWRLCYRDERRPAGGKRVHCSLAAACSVAVSRSSGVVGDGACVECRGQGWPFMHESVAFRALSFSRCTVCLLLLIGLIKPENSPQHLARQRVRGGIGAIERQPRNAVGIDGERPVPGVVHEESCRLGGGAFRAFDPEVAEGVAYFQDFGFTISGAISRVVRRSPRRGRIG